MANVGTIIAMRLQTGNVAVIGEEAFTQVSWDDAFTSGSFTCPRSSYPSGANLKPKNKEKLR
jgi:hypothetical protein